MSKLTGQVLDDDSWDPIPEAEIYLLNSDGTRNSILATTNQDGMYEFNAPSFGKKVEISYPGYTAQEVDPAYIPASGIIYLVPNPNSISEAVVITAHPNKKKPAKPNYLLPAIIAGASVLMFSVWAYRRWS